MKKNLLSAAFIAVLLLTTGCTNEMPCESNGIQNKTVIVASMPKQEADTRLSFEDQISKLNINWEAEDKIGIYSGGTYSTLNLESGEGTKNAIFTATSQLKDIDRLYGIFPNTFNPAYGAIYVNLGNGQSGTLEKLSSFNLMTTALTFKNKDAWNITFNYRMAIVKLELTFPNSATGDATQIGISSPDLHSYASLTVANGTFSYLSQGDVTTRDNALTIGSNGKLTTYLCVFPEALTNVKVIATANGTNFKKDLSDITLAAGNMYTVKATFDNP